MVSMPTADQVAMAVITAGQALRVDAEEVVGARPTKVPVAAARARAYAALAINHVFNGEKPATKHGAYALSRVAIARMVGVPEPSQPGFVLAIEDKLRRRLNMAWWRPEVLRRVINAVRSAGDGRIEIDKGIAELQATSPAPKPAQRPAPPKPQPQPHQPVYKPAPPPSAPGVRAFTRGAISVDPDGWWIGHGERRAKVADPDAFRVAAALARVSPALLVTEDIATRLWPGDRDGQARVRQGVVRANAALAPIGLKISEMRKFGYCLAET